MIDGIYYYAALACTATLAACFMALMLDATRIDDDE